MRRITEDYRGFRIEAETTPIGRGTKLRTQTFVRFDDVSLPSETQGCAPRRPVKKQTARMGRSG
jgi:hypothetical protein